LLTPLLADGRSATAAQATAGEHAAQLARGSLVGVGAPSALHQIGLLKARLSAQDTSRGPESV